VTYTKCEHYQDTISSGRDKSGVGGEKNKPHRAIDMGKKETVPTPKKSKEGTRRTGFDGGRDARRIIAEEEVKREGGKKLSVVLGEGSNLSLLLSRREQLQKWVGGHASN